MDVPQQGERPRGDRPRVAPLPAAVPDAPAVGPPGRALAALRTLLRSSHLAGPDDLGALAAEAGACLGAERGALYLVDYDQVELVSLPPEQAPEAEHLPIEGTIAGRTFSDLVPHSTHSSRGQVWWTPVLNGTERLGVLRLDFPPERPLDDELQAACLDVAALLAELVLTRSGYGDAVERARRRTGMTLPAEMQWTLLPPLTFVTPRVAVAGVLAPTAEVAGDAFDYALNGDTLHVAVLDAMGHGLEAALLSAVAVGAMRNARRSGVGLAGTVRAVEGALAAQFGGDRFVTGIVGELDVPSGWWRWTTCGHPAALLVRSGRVVKSLDSVVGAPLGLGLLADEPPVGQERLEPGDRILLYTDGVVEARDSSGAFFETDRLADFVTQQAAAGRPVAETLRRLNLAILDHQDGRLQDDATTVLVEWLTDEPERTVPLVRSR